MKLPLRVVVATPTKAKRLLAPLRLRRAGHDA